MTWGHFFLSLVGKRGIYQPVLGGSAACFLSWDQSKIKAHSLVQSGEAHCFSKRGVSSANSLKLGLHGWGDGARELEGCSGPECRNQSGDFLGEGCDSLCALSWNWGGISALVYPTPLPLPKLPLCVRLNKKPNPVSWTSPLQVKGNVISGEASADSAS